MEDKNSMIKFSIEVNDEWGMWDILKALSTEVRSKFPTSPLYSIGPNIYVNTEESNEKKVMEEIIKFLDKNMIKFGFSIDKHNK